MSAEQHTVEYRDIPDWPGYRAGSDGSIWSCWKPQARPPRRHDHWHQLAPQAHPKTGHLWVLLCPGAKLSFVHRLVLEAFVGPCPPGHEARHFPDRDPTNNRRENLSWGTKKQNQADRIAHGTDRRGEKHWKAKLTTDQILVIRAAYALAKRGRKKAPNGLRASFAQKYGVSVSQIKKIIRGDSWAHLTCPAAAPALAYSAPDGRTQTPISRST